MLKLKIYFGKNFEWNGFTIQNGFMYGVDTNSNELIATSGFICNGDLRLYRLVDGNWVDEYIYLNDDYNLFEFEDDYIANDIATFEKKNGRKIDYEDGNSIMKKYSSYYDDLEEIDRDYDLEDEEYSRQIKKVEQYYAVAIENGRGYNQPVTELMVWVWRRKIDDLCPIED